jgi:hypothetical protein
MRYSKYYNYKKSKSIVNNDGSVTLLLFLEVISFTGFAGMTPTVRWSYYVLGNSTSGPDPLQSKRGQVY